jgi:hypothetical protein
VKDSHEHVPREHRGEDQRVHRAAPSAFDIEHHAEAAEIQLALHPWFAIRDPHCGLPPTEAAPLGRETVQRPVRHHHTATGQLSVNVGQLQPIGDPIADLLLQRQQRLPRRTMTLRPLRTNRLHDNTDQLVGQLSLAALADQARSDRGIDVPAGRLAIHAGPLGD